MRYWFWIFWFFHSFLSKISKIRWFHLLSIWVCRFLIIILKVFLHAIHWQILGFMGKVSLRTFSFKLYIHYWIWLLIPRILIIWKYDLIVLLTFWLIVKNIDFLRWRIISLKLIFYEISYLYIFICSSAWSIINAIFFLF